MQSSKWSTITGNRPSSSEFFLRSPFRHPYFLVATFVLACTVVICAFVLVWAHVPLLLSLWLVSALCFLIPAWVFGLRIHKQIQLLLATGQVEKLEIGSPLDVALSAASNMINIGLCFTFAGALTFLAVFIEVIRFH